MRVLCYSVRLESLVSISDKAFLARAFDGSEAIIPKSQVLGDDYDVSRSDAYWISAWILQKKEIQYSTKKKAWVDSQTGRVFPDITIEKHMPERVKPIKTNPNAELIR